MVMDDMEKDHAKKLAEDHWGFLEKWQCMIFNDAFLHGWKHAEQYGEVNGMRICDVKSCKDEAVYFLRTFKICSDHFDEIKRFIDSGIRL